MKRFEVIISPSAEADIAESFVWGLTEWSIEQAEKWVVQLRREIARLRTLPLRCPIAPESEEMAIELRHLIIGRYRVLFYVKDDEIRVTHVRGAFVKTDRQDIGVMNERKRKTTSDRDS